MEEELLNNGDKISKALQKQQAIDLERTGLPSELAYSTNRRDVGRDFQPFNKFDRNVTLGIDQNENRSTNTNLKAGRALFRLPRNIVGEVFNTLGAGVQLVRNPIDTFSGELDEINPLAEMLMDFGKELSQGDSFRMTSLYTSESGVFDPGDADWWAKTIEGWGPTVGMMAASMGTGAVVKGGTSAVTRAVANQAGKMIARRKISRLARKEAVDAAQDYVKKNLPKATTAAQRKAVYDTAKGIKASVLKKAKQETREIVSTQGKNFSELAKRSSTIQNIEGYAQNIATSLLSRNGETFVESKQTYDLVLARSKEQHPERTEEEHKRLAAEAASTNYQNGMMLAFIDMYQYSKILGKFDKGAKKVQKTLLGNIKTYVQQAVSEGLEETLQYSFSKQAQQKSQIFGEQNVLETFLSSYTDKEFQESFVQGALGGIMFQAIGDGISAISKGKNKKADQAAEDSEKIDKEVADKKETKKGTKKGEVPNDPDLGDETETPNDVDTGDETLTPDDVDTGDDMINLGQTPDDIETEAPDYYNDEVPDDVDTGDDQPAGVPDDVDLGDETDTPNDPDLGEDEGYFPAEEYPQGVDPEGVATAVTMAENPDLAEAANEELGTNFNDDVKNNYEQETALEAVAIEEELGGMRDSLKKTHPDDHKLAEAHIFKDAIKRNSNLTAQQKKDLMAPYDRVINEHKEKGITLTAKQINGYKKHGKLATKAIDNRAKELNSDKVTEPKDKDVSQLKDNQLIKLSQSPNLSEEDKAELQLELESRKQTPEIKRALQQLLQEPITPEKIDELDVDPEEMIGRALIAVVNKIGNQVNIVEGPLGYDYDTNTLSFPKDATPLDKVLAIAKELTKQNDPVVKQVEKILSDQDVNIPFSQVIEQIFSDTEFAVYLMNKSSDIKNKSLLDRILDKLMELLGIKDNNLFNETLALFHNAIQRNAQDAPKINTHPAIPLGRITNIVSPYKMLTYQGGQPFHNRKPVTIQGGRKPFIEINGKKLYVDPGYKSNLEDGKRVTILLNEDGTPATTNLYTKRQLKGMQKDIPYQAELKVKLEKDTDADTSVIGLYHQGTRVGILPGWFPEKPSQPLKELRETIYDRHIDGKPLGTVTFDGSIDNIIRNAINYRWDEVLPSDQMDNPEIGVITEVDKTLNELTGYPVGMKIIQFDIDTFEPYNGSQPAGKPVMYVKNARGVRVPIQGESVLFRDNEGAQQRLFDIINTTPENELQEAIRDLVKWTTPTTKGYKVNLPIVQEGWITKNTKTASLKDLEEGDYILPFNEADNKTIKGNYGRIVSRTDEDNPRMRIEFSDGTVFDGLANSTGIMVHPYTTFMKEQNILGRPIQLDRDRMSDTNYLKEVREYMKFNVSPGVFGIPERKVVMKLNVPEEVKQDIVEQQQEAIERPAEVAQVTQPVQEDVPVDNGWLVDAKLTPKEMRKLRKKGKLDDLNELNCPRND